MSRELKLQVPDAERKGKLETLAQSSLRLMQGKAYLNLCYYFGKGRWVEQRLRKWSLEAAQ